MVGLGDIADESCSTGLNVLESLLVRTDNVAEIVVFGLDDSVAQGVGPAE